MEETNNPLVGRRVRLLCCTDTFTLLRPGATGTVSSVDDAHTVHVDWDNGSRLGLVEDAGDRFELVLDGPASMDTSVPQQ